MIPSRPLLPCPSPRLSDERQRLDLVQTQAGDRSGAVEAMRAARSADHELSVLRTLDTTRKVAHLFDVWTGRVGGRGAFVSPRTRLKRVVLFKQQYCKTEGSVAMHTRVCPSGGKVE